MRCTFIVPALSENSCSCRTCGEALTSRTCTTPGHHPCGVCGCATPSHHPCRLVVAQLIPRKIHVNNLKTALHMQNTSGQGGRGHQSPAFKKKGPEALAP
eukprot:s451_g12.t1